MMIYFFRYQKALLALLIQGEIGFGVWRAAFWRQHAVVAGSRCAFIVDPDFEQTCEERSARLARQQSAGLGVLLAGDAYLTRSARMAGEGGRHADGA